MRRFLRKTFLTAAVPLLALLAPGTASAQSGSVIASDNFNRPNETPFAVNGNWGRVIAGNYDGFGNLINNQVASASNEGSYYWKGAGAGSFDPTRQFSRLKVVQKDGEVGVTLLAGPDQAIMVAWGPPGVGDTVYIYWYSGGSDRGQLATGSSTINNGDVVEAVLEGGIIYAKVNGVTVRSVANTTTLTSGVPGFITFRNTSLPYIAILDDWQGGTPQSYSVGGTITEQGSGLGGVIVTATGGYSGSTTTNGAGAYAFPGVGAGTTSITLTPTLSGHTMSPLSQTIAGPLNGDISNVNFTSTLNTTATLTVNATHGSVIRNPDQPTYAFGTDVTLTPVADQGYDFSTWSGDVPAGHEMDNPLHVIMSGDRTVTAHFTSPGVVASDGFNRANETPLTVGGTWQRSLSTGLANLTANHIVGASSDAIYYWQGPGTFDPTRQFARAKVTDTGGQAGVVLLGASQQALVAAWSSGTLYIYWYKNGVFQGNLVQTSSSLNPGDVVEVALDGGTIYAKVNGVVVKSVANTTTLTTGQPGLETYLSGGGLDDWEAGTPESFTISGTITENSVGLSGVQVSASGGFAGAATTNGNGVYTIPGVPIDATSILLTPVLPGHTMSPTSKTVAGPVTGNVTGVDFTSAVNTTATLTVLSSHGIVTKDPDQASYPIGAVVTVTPYADGGFEFAGWSGDVPAGHGADNPLHLTMNQDRTVAANFVAAGFVAADYFDRADEIPLSVTGNWRRVRDVGLSALINNRIEGYNYEAVYYWDGAGIFDSDRQFARERVVSAGGQVGLVLLGSPGRALVVAWGGGRLYIYWYFDNLHQGELANLASTLNDGDLIEAELNQGWVYAKINGVVVASVPNTTSLNFGKPGFETYLTGGIVDDWEAGIPAFTCVGAPNGTPCSDGNTCTQSDSCQSGVCVGTNPVVCTASDACHVAGTCDSQTGACSNPVAADGTSCSDGSACTQSDSCQSGVCVGTNPIVCTVSDQCHVAGTCDAQTGACSNPVAADGTGCADGNLCTTGDSCQSGLCVGTNPVVCTASDACHVAGTCDSQTGACSNPIAADGTSCSDGSSCTTDDACNAGLCSGTPMPPPAEVTGISIQGHSTTTLSWTAVPGVVYDVATASLSELMLNGTDSATCLADNLTSASYVDTRPQPVEDDGFYYLIRAQNACGAGSYGAFSEGGQRFPSAACP